MRHTTLSAVLTAGVVVGACLIAGNLAAAEPAQQPAARAIEPWASKELQITRGLVAWFDATAENACRRARGAPELRDGQPLDIWHDASGWARDLRQAKAAAQPILRFDKSVALARFDGHGASLSADQLQLACEEITLFVVAVPFANAGGFRGFLALNATGRNDYQSGLNLDQGAGRADRSGPCNVEGAGFAGQRMFPGAPAPFGQLRRWCVTSAVGPGGTAFYAEGKLAGQRDRGPAQIRADRLTVGARFYNNGGPPDTRGFLAGEIAEVLIYDRLLPAAEREDVERYLAAKYGHVGPVAIPAAAEIANPVPRIADPPPLQMLAPGFAVRRLPVDLNNVNNVLYRDDGKLLALTYDGRLFLLSDSDGDGLEDRADVFWDRSGIIGPIGMALTPPGYARGRGAFVACKHRIVLIVDRDGDDQADEEIVVAEGWPKMEHRLDALGVEIGPDGSVYFGLGTPNFTNGYLLDGQRKAHFDPTGERGAILKVSPDFQRRELMASGVRFSVAIRMNRAGDLFCTDQEGATWLPNGNPFDELLHIQPGRYYGFPPRHPQHLPQVVDEPSVYDYSPQHQSTCGLCFNEPRPGARPIGPDWWQGNALVTGYSRGKLYRTTLVQTAYGYVADNALLGCVKGLPADLCLSPGGALVVAVHGGGPDWGSGPAGKGQLYKIAYADRECPQPVRAWASSPHEVQIEFDRPLDAAQFQSLARSVQIETGPFVRAGDRFESFRPGYAVVERQMASPRALLPVHGASIAADGRAMLLNTGEYSRAVHYAVMLPGPKREPANTAIAGALPQMPVIELTYDLSGVSAEWRPKAGGAGWSMWLPHVDPAVSAGLLTGSQQAARLAAAWQEAGQLTLRTQLDCWQMLRPAVQPGSTLDAALPAEKVTVVFESESPLFQRRTADGWVLSATADGPSSDGLGEPAAGGAGSRPRHRTEIAVEPREDRWVALEISVRTGSLAPPLAASWFTAEDARPRAFAQRRFLLPWARPAGSELPAARPIPAELAGGNWKRGQQVFSSEAAQCSKCHTIRGRGGWIGPDLSNLIHRDYASVLRDVTQPSYAINPDHLAYTVVVDDGRTLTGMVQTRGDNLVVGDIKGAETIVPRSAVESLTPTRLSIMPEGLPKAVGDAGMRDLLTFLLLPDPDELTPAPIEAPHAPPPRSRAELQAVLQGAAPVEPASLKPLEIVLVSGPKDHGPGEHDYPLWRQRWSRLLALAPHAHVTTADEWPSADQWQRADCVVVFSANPGWSPERARQMDAFFDRGGGMVFLHYALNGQRAPEELAQRIGLAWQPGQSKFRHGPLDLKFAAETRHPIIAGFEQARFVDESYWNLAGDPARITVLATQVEDQQPRPLLWTCEPGHGRVFVSIPGHYNWTFDDPLFRVLVLRGIAWTTNQPIARMNDAILPGTRTVDP